MWLAAALVTITIVLVRYSNPTWGNPIRPYYGDGKSDVFIAKLDSSGALIWNTFLGGSEDDEIGGIVVDGNGNIYVAGNSSSSWGNPIQAHRNNGADSFIAKLNSSGALTWNTFLGSIGVTGIDLGGDGNIYLTGSSANDWSIANVPLHARSGDVDAYVVKMTPSGSLIWHTFLGGSSQDNASEIVVSADGNIYVAGTSYSTWGNPLRPYIGNFSDGFCCQTGFVRSIGLEHIFRLGARLWIWYCH